MTPDYNPHTNKDVITLIKQPDGNWVGITQRYDRVITVRDVGPETVLQRLLTHDGQID